MNALLLKLKLPDEAAWQSMFREHFAIEVDGQWRPKPGVQIVVIGTAYHATGAMLTVTGPGGTPIQVPERIAQPGYLVDVIAPDVPTALHPFLVNPTQPVHVFYGNHVLAMPETLPEAEEVVMVSRGIGAQVPDDQLARLELAVLRGRITPEMAEDRRAWIEAGIAIAESRAALDGAREQRKQAVEDAQKAAAERTAILALRDAEVAKRDAEDAKRVAAVAAAQAATGAARTAALTARDAAIDARNAATARASKLEADAALKATAQAAAVKVRDDAAAVLDAERVKIAAARSARAEAKAAIVEAVAPIKT
jgi:hypothetical protein